MQYKSPEPEPQSNETLFADIASDDLIRHFENRLEQADFSVSVGTADLFNSEPVMKGDAEAVFREALESFEVTQTGKQVNLLAGASMGKIAYMGLKGEERAQPESYKKVPFTHIDVKFKVQVLSGAISKLKKRIAEKKEFAEGSRGAYGMNRAVNVLTLNLLPAFKETMRTTKKYVALARAEIARDERLVRFLEEKIQELAAG